MSDNLKNGHNANIYKNTLTTRVNTPDTLSDNETNVNEISEDKDILSTKFRMNNVVNVSQFNRDNLRELFYNTGIIKQRLKKEVN